ncbi:ATP-binding protein [Candidatus Neptunochlamydia vexilliferae]|nr:AAA family ATPase [Candidatus Neptunochlamydia vexilliferae]
MNRDFLNKLLAWKGDPDRKPLVIRGVRQAGKTYLLKKFGEEYKTCHYLNFEEEGKLLSLFEEDLNPKRIITDLSFHLGQPINLKTDLLIFDEVQACPKALTSLKYFYEKLPELHLCAAGSLLGIHLAPFSFPVGKVTFLTMRPMSFEEFLEAADDQKSVEILRNLNEESQISEIVHHHLWERLKHYLIVGGMPEAVATYCKYQDDLFTAFEKVRAKQKELVIAYYADMAKHSGKVNALHINRIFRSAPTQIHQVQDGSISKFKFRGVIPGVSHYHRLATAIDWLEAAGLVLKVHIVNSANLPLKGFTKENQFKLLLFDVGILGSMCDLSPELILGYDYGTYKGYFAENFVAQELMLSQNRELFCWSEKNSELEFLLESRGKVIPIEVKSGSTTRSKSLKVFSEKYHPETRVVLSGKPFSIDPQKGTHHYPLYSVSSLQSSLLN